MLQGKLLKWWRMRRNLQMKNTQTVQNTDMATADEQRELEDLYLAFNDLLAKNRLLEKKNLALQEEMNALHLRNDREKKEFMKYAISEFAADIVCVADNIRRAIETVPKEELDAFPALINLVEGFEVTERSLLTALNSHRVTRFDPLGEPCNPHLHEAKSTVSAPDLPANTVVEVIHAGFMIDERLLRPAGVVVAQAGAPTQPAAQHAADDQASPALSGATGSERYTQQAGASERSSSVLHKPVITAAEGIPAATHPIGVAPDDSHHGTPEDWRINQGQQFLHESLGALRNWAEDPSNYTHEAERDWPSVSVQEAADEAAEMSLTSDPATAIEDVQDGTDTVNDAVNDAFESKNYAEAARLQERIAAATRLAETAAGEEPGDATLDALLSLSWYQLCAGQYDAVIMTADRAAAIREDYISIDTNRAHALMLMGSTDEARTIYNKHRGKETRNKKIWDREVLDDFAELELENIEHPLMNELRSAWAEEG